MKRFLIMFLVILGAAVGTAQEPESDLLSQITALGSAQGAEREKLLAGLSARKESVRNCITKLFFDQKYLDQILADCGNKDYKTRQQASKRLSRISFFHLKRIAEVSKASKNIEQKAWILRAYDRKPPDPRYHPIAAAHYRPNVFATGIVDLLTQWKSDDARSLEIVLAYVKSFQTKMPEAFLNNLATWSKPQPAIAKELRKILEYYPGGESGAALARAVLALSPGTRQETYKHLYEEAGQSWDSEAGHWEGVLAECAKNKQLRQFLIQTLPSLRRKKDLWFGLAKQDPDFPDAYLKTVERLFEAKRSPYGTEEQAALREKIVFTVLLANETGKALVVNRLRQADTLYWMHLGQYLARRPQESMVLRKLAVKCLTQGARPTRALRRPIPLCPETSQSLEKWAVNHLVSLPSARKAEFLSLISRWGLPGLPKAEHLQGTFRIAPVVATAAWRNDVDGREQLKPLLDKRLDLTNRFINDRWTFADVLSALSGESQLRFVRLHFDQLKKQGEHWGDPRHAQANPLQLATWKAARKASPVRKFLEGKLRGGDHKDKLAAAQVLAGVAECDALVETQLVALLKHKNWIVQRAAAQGLLFVRRSQERALPIIIEHKTSYGLTWALDRADAGCQTLLENELKKGPRWVDGCAQLLAISPENPIALKSLHSACNTLGRHLSDVGTVADLLLQHEAATTEELILLRQKVRSNAPTTALGALVHHFPDQYRKLSRGIFAGLEAKNTDVDAVLAPRAELCEIVLPLLTELVASRWSSDRPKAARIAQWVAMPAKYAPLFLDFAESKEADGQFKRHAIVAAGMTSSAEPAIAKRLERFLAQNQDIQFRIAAAFALAKCNGDEKWSAELAGYADDAEDRPFVYSLLNRLDEPLQDAVKRNRKILVDTEESEACRLVAARHLVRVARKRPETTGLFLTALRKAVERDYRDRSLIEFLLESLAHMEVEKSEEALKIFSPADAPFALRHSFLRLRRKTEQHKK